MQRCQFGKSDIDRADEADKADKTGMSRFEAEESWLRKASSEPCLERGSAYGMGHSGASPSCWRASGQYQDRYIQVSYMQ
jgi:hypothetical protein